MTGFARSALSLLSLACLAACSSMPTTASVALTGGKDLNPTAGAANPVQVRLYQLKSTARFSNADYYQLQDKESATLGDELVAREDQFIRPGETITVPLAVKPGARFLGVAASFRDIDHATWRTTAPLASHIPITLMGDQVKVAAK